MWWLIAIAFEDEFVVKGNEDASCTEDSFATMVAELLSMERGMCHKCWKLVGDECFFGQK
jgi:hypothetical protein